MRLFTARLSLLLALPLLLPAAASAQPAAGTTKWTVQPGTNVPADWALSMEARMQRQLAEMRQSNSGLRGFVPGCPIAFSARRQGSLGLRATTNPGPNPGPGVDLTFGAGPRRVVEAGITVYGWSNQLRMVPAAYPPETSESFVLKGSSDEPLLQQLVWMKRLGVVNSVELTRVVFADGGTWVQSGNLHCTVRPSKLVLVNASPLK